ncbi:ABC transporter ATP-binding protein [Arcticibacterium luteifluviistationis]|uniref:ABC transporter ATP-binding protein n=1 Tax=Arcticibacterium luteifluviistationis TaxID=1784714 RepID=A0A2Z4GID6_9BACT|nr:ABC transporter ATP-binding protein [Arcticibacterium luteifluviistationis]
MLQTKNLQHSYTKGIDFVYPDLHCDANQQLLILGESGKGKSTLLHLLGLILPIQQGSVSINGIETSELNSSKAAAFRANNIGIIFQQHQFVKSLTVLDNILLANYYAKKSLDKAKVKQTADRLEISDLLHKKVYELSGGEMQRIGIARALQNEPKLLLADEPTSNLDDVNCERVYQLLADTATEQKAALVIVTHDQRLKNKIANQIHL